MEWVGRPGSPEAPDRPVVRAGTRFPGIPLHVDVEEGEHAPHVSLHCSRIVPSTLIAEEHSPFSFFFSHMCVPSWSSQIADAAGGENSGRKSMRPWRFLAYYTHRPLSRRVEGKRIEKAFSSPQVRFRRLRFRHSAIRAGFRLRLLDVSHARP